MSTQWTDDFASDRNCNESSDLTALRARLAEVEALLVSKAQLVLDQMRRAETAERERDEAKANANTVAIPEDGVPADKWMRVGPAYVAQLRADLAAYEQAKRESP